MYRVRGLGCRVYIPSQTKMATLKGLNKDYCPFQCGLHGVCLGCRRVSGLLVRVPCSTSLGFRVLGFGFRVWVFSAWARMHIAQDSYVDVLFRPFFVAPGVLNLPAASSGLVDGDP